MERNTDPGVESLYKDFDQIALTIGNQWNRDLVRTLVDRIHAAGMHSTGATINSIRAEASRAGGGYTAYAEVLMQGLMADWGVHRGLPIKRGSAYTERGHRNVFYRRAGGTIRNSAGAEFLVGYYGVAVSRALFQRVDRAITAYLATINRAANPS